MTLDQLGQIMDLMRAHGCVQLRDGDTHIVLGPQPTSTPARGRAAADPDADAMSSADREAVAAYQAHLYGGA